MTDATAKLSSQARDLLNDAGRSWREGRLQVAAEACRKALELVPDHAGGRNLAGVIAHRQGELKVALGHLERAVELAPDSAEYRQNMALVLLDAGEPAKAIGHLDRVLERETDNRQAMELRAEALGAAGEFEQAIAAWRDILGREPSHPIAEARILELVGRIDPSRHNPVLDDLLETLLDSARVEPNLLAVPLARRVMARHGLTEEGVALPLDALADDALLRKSLQTLYFTEPHFDRVLTALRRRLMLTCHEQGRIPARWQPLIAALAVHNLRCEYVHAAEDDELQALAQVKARLEERLTEAGVSLSTLVGPLMLVGMYRSPAGIEGLESLALDSDDAPPAAVRRLIRMAFVEPARERVLAEALPVLGEIRGETSEAVQAMYEAHPYPRWEKLGPVAPGTLADRLRLQLPDFEPPAFADDARVDVLIAGCGTGRHALRAACEYENARVLAMDISLRSLGYAARKAEEMEVKNLQFLQADLFDLPKLERRFHVVETIGTLETLDDPAAGWRVLAEMLEPGGLMYVGSYSETSRRPVVRARERIRELGLAGTDDDMRTFRRRVFDGELGEDGWMLMHCGDFYSLSGCRDFLFHVREKRFTIRQLSELWRDSGLRFLGFHPVRPPLRDAYRQRFPDDPLARNLDNWIRFEESDPDEFCRLMNLSMLYYWLCKGEALGVRH